MGIPTGLSYPKMVTGTDTGGRTVPLVFPPGHAKQFTYVILVSAADEAAYPGNGITPQQAGSSTTPSSPSGSSSSWENRHHG